MPCLPVCGCCCFVSVLVFVILSSNHPRAPSDGALGSFFPFYPRDFLPSDSAVGGPSYPNSGASNSILGFGGSKEGPFATLAFGNSFPTLTRTVHSALQYVITIAIPVFVILTHVFGYPVMCLWSLRGTSRKMAFPRVIGTTVNFFSRVLACAGTQMWVIPNYPGKLWID